jgi:arylsulfatase A-like enzyme
LNIHLYLYASGLLFFENAESVMKSEGLNRFRIYAVKQVFPLILYNTKRYVKYLSAFIPICFFTFHNKILFAQDARPNIIYIMADDLGYADLSCYGRKDYATPHLDKLAEEGIKFTNAYSAAPVCTPTRTAFMTGRYPARTRVGLWEPLRKTSNDVGEGLSSTQTSLASLLKNAGYETALIGKWHLGFMKEFGPLKNGFDEFYGFHEGAIDYVSHTYMDGQNSLYDNEIPVTQEGYMTDLLREQAILFLQRKHKKPFFLSIQFNAPHWPWQGPTDKKYSDSMPWREGGSPLIFSEMMKSLDEAVGAVLNALDSARLLTNTIVIFTSDNGGERFSDMGIFSGSKIELELNEGGIRVPAIVRWLGKIPAGSKTDQLAITMDWTATILAIAGAKPDVAFPLDGENLMPVCTGQKGIYKRTFYWRTFQEGEAKAIRDGNLKYIYYQKAGEFLFNLETDPSEKNNLKKTNKAQFKKLKKKFADWEKTVLSPIAL